MSRVCDGAYESGQQELISLVMGIALAPFGDGVFLLLVWIVVYEIIYYYITKDRPGCWSVRTRIGIILASFLGWIIGRQLTGKDIMSMGERYPFHTRRPVIITDRYGRIL